ncbi:hypothetical protein Q4591_12030 [Shewanella sp. 3_MG-2023]|uniref:hypothetical protein n=1 Tax=Shewanella sp. 3_MG-2023 TaxID=3062635 RepID=UPI0026E38F2F|nr:hypothetical protein [Shewanella sp. 3_MG-2023]MDO6776087.1 hypothetical protein [Shewanella sp. 3_MG-2023]
MNAFLHTSVQPLSSYNPSNINGHKNVSAISTNAVVKLSALQNQTQLTNQTDTLDAVKDDSKQLPALTSAEFDSKLDAKLQYDNDMASATRDKPLKDHCQTLASAGAIQEYLINQHSAQREHIQQMVGIDLYA